MIGDATVQDSPLSRACGDEPGWMCELLLEVTGSETAASLIDRVLGVPLRIALALALAYVLYRLARRWIGRFVQRMELEIERRVERARELGTRGGSRRAETRRLQRLHAIGGAIRGGVGIAIWIAAILYALSQLVDLRPILAGAGLAGLVVGFGAQNLIRDFLAGISMLVEDQFGVGDWIDVEGTVGEVEQVGLRTTRMRDIDGVVWHIPNGHVQKVGNLTQHWARATLDVPFALDTDIPAARALIQRVADHLAADPEWGQDIIGPPEIWGVQEWGPDGLALRLVVPTRPLRNWDVARQLRERLKHAFERAGIRMPVPMREIGAQRVGEPIRIVEAVPEPHRPSAAVDDDLEPRDTTQRIPLIRPPGPPGDDGD